MGSASMDNDTRGWVMCIVSGIACVAGASIIYVDVLVRFIPGLKHFRVHESNTFLACSLSLSFGVMLFSALNSMLPSSMRYLTQDDMGEQRAGFIMMACFAAGFVGIQLVSRLFHQMMPSHVVDCDHTHDEPVDDHHAAPHRHRPALSIRGRRHSAGKASPPSSASGIPAPVNGSTTESTPLLSADTASSDQHPRPDARGPSILRVQERVMSFVKDTKANCDQFGPCYGYTDPCGQECFKHLTSRFPSAAAPRSHGPAGPPADSHDTLAAADSDESRANTHVEADGEEGGGLNSDGGPDGDSQQTSEDLEAQHHHHVPTNAFLSISLQTVIAIAVHKFPEGFITYATNHANPALGFSVFTALFVHNIADGFAVALPLYMALGSRARALFWAALLGGLSQPAGAALAVLWFKIAQTSHVAIGNAAYACVFAATAGIMASVALQLFVESLSLNHNRNLNTFFAFVGMTVLGLSNALVAE